MQHMYDSRVPDFHDEFKEAVKKTGLGCVAGKVRIHLLPYCRASHPCLMLSLLPTQCQQTVGDTSSVPAHCKRLRLGRNKCKPHCNFCVAQLAASGSALALLAPLPAYFGQ
jgi:hypothetical protein